MISPSVDNLVAQLTRLPGVGTRTAHRLAFHLLQRSTPEANALADAIREVKERVRFCQVCGNLTEQEVCGICQDPRRDRSVICVVEQPVDVVSVERTAEYRGLYHVLQGRVSQVEGIGPDDLTTGALVARCRDGEIREVCLANNPDLEGEGTAQLVAERLRPVCKSVTRLARGMPAGGSITQLSKSILADALDGRRPLQPPT